MPTYHYKCAGCKHEESHFVRMSEFKRVLMCPACKDETLRLVPSATGGFILKGSGYYKTDFK